MKEPAAPLPWYNTNSIPCVLTGKQQRVCDVTPLAPLSILSGNPEDTELVFVGLETQQQNIDYIVEACNWYPVYVAYAQYVKDMTRRTPSEVPMDINEWLYVESLSNSPINQLVTKIKAYDH